MPRGTPIPAELRERIKSELREGKLPEFVADRYGVTIRTCQNYLYQMRAALRNELQAQGVNHYEIERRVHQVMRGDTAQFIVVDLPGRKFRPEFVRGGGLFELGNKGEVVAKDKQFRGEVVLNEQSGRV